MEVVHPDMMEINAELHSKLELLEEELRNTRELARGREERQGSGQEVERLRAQVVAEQNRAAQEKNKAQEMGKVVNYLEKELENAKKEKDIAVGSTAPVQLFMLNCSCSHTHAHADAHADAPGVEDVQGLLLGD